MDEFKIKPYKFDRDDEIIQLLHRVFSPWAGDKKYFDWKYKKYKGVGSTFANAWVIEKKNKIVAFNGYIVRKIKHKEKQFLAAQSFDTVTDPDYRGKGLFGVLQDQAYAAMKANDIKWVYGWTSEIGFKVFTKKVGWKVWGHQKFLMKVLNTKKFAKEKLSNPILASAASVLLAVYKIMTRLSSQKYVSVHVGDKLKGESAMLFDQATDEFDMIAIRDEEYVNWRFANPMNRSRILCIISSHNLRGYAVITFRDSAVDIDDCIVDSTDTLKALLANIEDIAVGEKKDMIRFRVNFGQRYTNTFKRSGFFWSRTEFPLLGKELDESISDSIDLGKIHWTVFDRNE